METQRKLIVILGPTASGKTDLSIKLAKKFNGEVISADSRQVYRGLDIGSAKITKKEMQQIPHYLIDVANPKTRFTVAQYQKLALKAIKNIFKKGKVPFLVGGSGFYIQSIIDGIVIPEVKPDWRIRKKLSAEPLPELVKRLKELDPARASIIDQNNPRRIVRALELVLKLKHPIAPISPNKPDFEVLILGVNRDRKELHKLIQKRLLKRLENNALINEVKKLHKSGVSWKRLEELGLEYRFVAQYLSRLRSNRGSSTKSGQNKVLYQEMIDNIQKESEHYVKRQLTWFKHDKRIHWINNNKKTEKLIEKFL